MTIVNFDTIDVEHSTVTRNSSVIFSYASVIADVFMLDVFNAQDRYSFSISIYYHTVSSA